MATLMFRQAYESILAELAEMPLFLERVFTGLSPEYLHRLPDDDSSPLLEHLWHVRDCDVDLYGARIDAVLAEDRPTLAGVDVNAWPAARHYMQRSADVAVAEFAVLRRQLIARLAELDEAALSRTGVHFTGTPMNVLGIIEQLAAHDRDHRWRIAAILRGYAMAPRVL